MINSKKKYDPELSDAIAQYILERDSNRNPIGVENDIRSLYLTDYYRNGDYSFNFGGRKRLPIFVTNNTGLIGMVINFTQNNHDKYILPWSPRFVPIISDFDLMSRLWLTSNKFLSTDISMLQSAFLFQQSDNEFYDRVMATYKEVKKKHNFDVINIDDERYEKLEELIVANTKGEITLVDDEIVAASFEELAERISLEKDDRISSLSEDINKLINTISNRYNKSIKLRFRNCSVLLRIPQS